MLPIRACRLPPLPQHIPIHPLYPLPLLHPLHPHCQPHQAFRCQPPLLLLLPHLLLPPHSPPSGALVFHHRLLPASLQTPLRALSLPAGLLGLPLLQPQEQSLEHYQTRPRTLTLPTHRSHGVSRASHLPPTSPQLRPRCRPQRLSDLRSPRHYLHYVHHHPLGRAQQRLPGRHSEVGKMQHFMLRSRPANVKRDLPTTIAQG